MPTINIYNHGTSGGTPGMNKGKAGIRGEVGGWSAQTSRRNMQFLWSVTTEHLTGQGYSFTLTIRDCPKTPLDWGTWCKAYWKRVEAAGALRIHWVIEWQRRGCPHLHGSVYFPDSMSTEDVDNALLDGWVYKNPFRPGRMQQQCNRIYDAVGWAQYVAKHAARGVKHIQRSPECMPEQWQGKTGRMWGYRGPWPRREPLRIGLQDWRGDGGWYPFRRLVRSWAVSKARSKGDRSAQVYARRMLRANTRELGEVRGVSSWVPRHVVELLLENVDSRGYSVILDAFACEE